jgi:hypothetical protein
VHTFLFLPPSCSYPIYLRVVLHAYDEKYKKKVAALLILEVPTVLSCQSSDLLESFTI